MRRNMTWKIQRRAVLMKNDAWSYVSGGLKPEIISGNAASMEAVRRWIEENLKAQSDIILEIMSLEFNQVKRCGTMREACKNLEEIQQTKKPVRKVALMN